MPVAATSACRPISSARPPKLDSLRPGVLGQNPWQPCSKEGPAYVCGRAPLRHVLAAVMPQHRCVITIAADWLRSGPMTNSCSQLPRVLRASTAYHTPPCLSNLLCTEKKQVKVDCIRPIIVSAAALSPSQTQLQRRSRSLLTAQATPRHLPPPPAAAAAESSQLLPLRTPSCTRRHCPLQVPLLPPAAARARCLPQPAPGVQLLAMMRRPSCSARV